MVVGNIILSIGVVVGVLGTGKTADGSSSGSAAISGLVEVDGVY